MSADDDLSLSIVFTGDLSQLGVVIDQLKAKIEQLNNALNAQAGKMAENIKKTEEPTRKMKKAVDDLGKSTDGLKKSTDSLTKSQEQTAAAGKGFADASKEQKKQLDASSDAISKAVGNSARYQEALAKVSAQHEIGTVRYNQLKSALDKAERSILQTASSMFRSKTAGEEWANSIDRTRVMNSFLNGELVKINGQLLSSSKSTKELALTQKELASQYDYLGAEGRRHIGMLGTQYKSVESLKTSLKGLRDAFLQSNSATVAAQGAIQTTASRMNQLGQSGTAWAKSVDVARVANAFLKDEVIKVNGQLLSQSKTTAQLESAVEKLGQKYSNLGNVEKYVGDRLGTSIKSMGQMEAALKSASERMKEKTTSAERLDRQVNTLQSSFGKFSGATEYMINKLKSGNISFNEAVNVMTKFKQSMAQQTETEKFNTNLMKLQAQADKLGPSFRAQGEAVVSSFRSQSTSFAEASNSLSGFVNQQKAAEAASSKLDREINNIRNTYRKYPEAVAEVVNAMRTQNMSYQEARTNMNMYKDMVSSVNETHKKAGSQATSTGNDFRKFASTIVGGGAASNMAAGYVTNLAVAMKSLAAWIPAAAVIGGFMGGIAAAVVQVKEFDQALKNLKAISGGTDAEISLLGDEMLRLSNSTKYSVSEIAKGAVFIAQAGFSASETMQVLSSSVRLAQSTLSDMSESADLLTTVLRVFHKDGSEAAHVADMLAVAANKSKTDIHGLRIAFNYLGPVAYAAKMSLQDTLGAIMALSNAGIRMSTVGTSMRQVISRLENPTAALSKAIHDAGMRLEDFNLGANGLVKVAINMGKVIQGDAGNALRYFGERAGNAALVISNLGPHLKTLIDFLFESGVAAQMAGTQMEGLDSKVKNLRNKFENLLVVFTEGAIGETLKALLDGMSVALDGFMKIMDNSAVKFVALFTLMVGSVKALHTAFRLLMGVGLASWVGMSREAVAGMITSTGVLATAITLLKSYYSTTIIAIRLFIHSLLETASTMGIVKAAVQALQAVLGFFAAAPLRLIPVLGALVAAYFTLTSASEKNSLELQKKAIQYSNAADATKGYIKDLDSLAKSQAAGNDITKENIALIARIRESYPALSAAMLANISSIEGQKQALKEFAEQQNKLAEATSKRVAEELIGQAQFNFKMANLYKEALEDNESFVANLLRAMNPLQSLFEPAMKQGIRWKMVMQDVLNFIGFTDVDRNVMLMNEYVKAMTQGFNTVEKMAAVVTAASPKIRQKFLEMIPDEKIKKQVAALVASNDQLKKMYEDINNTTTDGMQKKYLNMLMELDEEWRNYYKQQDAQGRKVVEDYMDQMGKKVEAEKRALDKGKISHEEYAERVKAIQDGTYTKMLEKQTAYVDQALKILERRYKDEQKMIQTNMDAGLALMDSKFKAESAMLEGSLGDKRNYLESLKTLETDHYKKANELAKESIDKEMALLTEQITKRRALLQSSNIDDKTRAAKTIELERWAYEEKMVIYKKEFDYYKKQLDDKTAQYKTYIDEIKRLEKEKVDAIKTGEKQLEDVAKIVLEANRLTMTEEEKLASKRKEFSDTLANAEKKFAEARSAANEDAKKAAIAAYYEYVTKAQGLISGLEVTTKTAENSFQTDAEATKRVRISAAQEVDSAIRKMMQFQTSSSDESVNKLKGNAETTKSEMEALAKGAESAWKKMQDAASVATHAAIVELTKLKEHIRMNNWDVVINFRGKASPEADLSITIANIQALLDNLAESVQDLEILMTFMASIDGEASMTMGEAIEAIKVQVATLQGALEELNAGMQIKVQFMGYGTSEVMEWLSNAFLKAESGAVWLSQRIAALSEEGIDFVIDFVGQDEGYYGYVSPLITSLIAKFEAMTAKISSMNPTYTITTVYKTVGSPSNAATQYAETSGDSGDYGGDSGGDYGGGEGYAEGGKVPGVGDGDSVDASLTPGEFVIRKSVVNMLGEGFFHFVNNLRSFTVPKFTRNSHIPAFASGGPVKEQSNQVFTLNLQAGGTKLPLKVVGDPYSTRKMIKQFEKELTKMGLSNGKVRNI